MRDGAKEEVGLAAMICVKHDNQGVVRSKQGIVEVAGFRIRTVWTGNILQVGVFFHQRFQLRSKGCRTRAVIQNMDYYPIFGVIQSEGSLYRRLVEVPLLFVTWEKDIDAWVIDGFHEVCEMQCGFLLVP